MADKLTDIGTLKRSLKAHGFFTKKALGQNFLVSSSVAKAIVNGAGITEEDIVVEIGPGIGSLTQYILEKTDRVLAIELDQKAIPVLLENTRKDLAVIGEDVLKVDIKEAVDRTFPDGGKVKVVANLPYYITTPILMYLLEEMTGIDSVTVMVQKEVGLRMLASPGGKIYGALTLAVNYYGEPSLVVDVPKGCFYPIPKVDSCVIHLKTRKEPLLEKGAQEGFFCYGEEFL